jgi:hypothetical protein
LNRDPNTRRPARRPDRIGLDQLAQPPRFEKERPPTEFIKAGIHVIHKYIDREELVRAFEIEENWRESGQADHSNKRAASVDDG